VTLVTASIFEMMLGLNERIGVEKPIVVGHSFGSIDNESALDMVEDIGVLSAHLSILHQTNRRYQQNDLIPSISVSSVSGTNASTSSSWCSKRYRTMQSTGQDLDLGVQGSCEDLMRCSSPKVHCAGWICVQEASRLRIKTSVPMTGAGTNQLNRSAALETQIRQQGYG
jgi:hypothetical protein